VNAEGTAVSVSLEVPTRPATTVDAPLPRTGWDAAPLVVIAIALVFLGALILQFVRTQLERTHA